MEDFFDILKIILPAGIVFATTYYLVNQFFKEDGKKRMLEIKIKNKSTITPVRLQAFERITLFLERINPNSMVMRANKKVPASMLQAQLLQIIRSEYEHNLSQQIYMTNNSWNAVVKAKEETIKLVNVAFSKVKAESSGMDYAQAIIGVAGQLKKLPTADAIKTIKKEIRSEF